MSEPRDIWKTVDAHTERLDAIEERLQRIDGEAKTGRNAPDAEPERCGCEQVCALERELEQVRGKLVDLQRALEYWRGNAANHKQRADEAERELARFREMVRAEVIREPLF
jgi:chromosome segregation ATPase